MTIRWLILLGLIGHDAAWGQGFSERLGGEDLGRLQLVPLADNSDAGIGPAEPEIAKRSIWRDLFACDAPLDRLWSFEFGVGWITDNVTSDFVKGDFKALDGPGGGYTYNFTVTRRVHQFNWKIGSVVLRPEIGVAGRLTLVDENTDRVIPDLNLGLMVRWRDFPWNRFLRTTFAFGGGMSYSFQPWTADIQRHPDDLPRSRLKFWLPFELSVALPMYPEHQLFAFIDHQSGGWTFDQGGVDAVGFGYRFEY